MTSIVQIAGAVAVGSSAVLGVIISSPATCAIALLLCFSVLCVYDTLAGIRRLGALGCRITVIILLLVAMLCKLHGKCLNLLANCLLLVVALLKFQRHLFENRFYVFRVHKSRMLTPNESSSPTAGGGGGGAQKGQTK